ncbi:MAG TPA: ferrochelatase [Candidatus Macondimonas sp.]|nr:ferrochelatase [Candidatus Macondimonas sp.]
MQASPTAPSDAPIGVLLTNLGSPEAPTPVAVRRYLAEFLSDSRVIEAPRWIWRPVLHGVILRIRPRRSAAAYASVWLPEGSPLLVYSRRQADALQQDLDLRFPAQYRVALAMRYGQPSVASGLECLRAAGCGRILILPLYPQYSATTTASVIDTVGSWLGTQRVIPELQWVNEYAEAPGYIAALAARVHAYWASNGRGDRLLMSFHGLPQRYADLGDPYPAQCRATARALARALDLPDDRWAMAFQSRFGPSRWLEPYTDEVLSRWAGNGVRTVDAVCPGFAADCLETLEEVALRYAEGYAQQGGTLRYIPALNDAPEHIAFLADLVIGRTRGWSD